MDKFDNISNYKLWSFLDDLKDLLSDSDNATIKQIGNSPVGRTRTDAEEREVMMEILARTISSMPATGVNVQVVK